MRDIHQAPPQAVKMLGGQGGYFRISLPQGGRELADHFGGLNLARADRPTVRHRHFQHRQRFVGQAAQFRSVHAFSRSTTSRIAG